MQFWPDFSRPRYNEQMESLGAEQKNHEEQHKLFTMTNGVKTILHFLTAFQHDSENWLRTHSDPAFYHVGTEYKHSVFGYSLHKEIKLKLIKMQVVQ